MSHNKVSVIVPVLNERNEIPTLLATLNDWSRVAASLHQQLEVIVVDGGSTDGTVKLLENASVVDHLCHSARGRATQMNVGAASATGSVLIFVHADTRFSHGAIEAVFQCLEHSCCWGFFQLRLSGADWRFRWIEKAINWRSSLTRVATGDQAMFVSRELFLRLGGFADIPLMEDVQLSKRLRKVCAPHILASVETSSRRWEKHGVYKTVLLMWLLRLGFFVGVPPRLLSRLY